MFSFVNYNNGDTVVIKLLKNLKIDITPETIVAEARAPAQLLAAIKNKQAIKFKMACLFFTPLV